MLSENKIQLGKTAKKNQYSSAFDFLGQWENHSSQYGCILACVSTFPHSAERRQFNKILHSYRISKDIRDQNFRQHSVHSPVYNW